MARIAWKEEMAADRPIAHGASFVNLEYYCLEILGTTASKILYEILGRNLRKAYLEDKEVKEVLDTYRHHWVEQPSMRLLTDKDDDSPSPWVLTKTIGYIRSYVNCHDPVPDNRIDRVKKIED